MYLYNTTLLFWSSTLPLPSTQIPFTTLTASVFFLFKTFPSYLNIFPPQFFTIEATPILSLKYLFLISTPLIHLDIIISAKLIFCSTFLSTAQQSDPYIITGLTTVLYNLLFNIIGILLSYRKPNTFLHFIHLNVILCSIFSSKLSFFCRTDPKSRTSQLNNYRVFLKLEKKKIIPHKINTLNYGQILQLFSDIYI